MKVSKLSLSDLIRLEGAMYFLGASQVEEAFREAGIDSIREYSLIEHEGIVIGFKWIGDEVRLTVY